MSNTLSWTWQDKPFQYTLSQADVLELARAVSLEGKPQSAVLWTLLQRFAMLRARGQATDLATFIRAYAQPLNPLWFSDGPKFQEHYAMLMKAGKKSEAAIEKKRAETRAVRSQMTWEQLPVTVRHLVETVLAGNRQSPVPPALHYWASRATPTMKPTEARTFNQSRRPELTLLDVGAGFGPDVNVFFASMDSAHLKDVRFGSGTMAGAIGGGLLTLLFLGYALYRWG